MQRLHCPVHKVNNVEDIVVLLGLKVFKLDHSGVFPAVEMRKSLLQMTTIENIQFSTSNLIFFLMFLKFTLLFMFFLCYDFKCFVIFQLFTKKVAKLNIPEIFQQLSMSSKFLEIFWQEKTMFLVTKHLINYPSPSIHTYIHILLAPDPIRVQSFVCCLF